MHRLTWHRDRVQSWHKSIRWDVCDIKEKYKTTFTGSQPSREASRLLEENAKHNLVNIKITEHVTEYIEVLASWLTLGWSQARQCTGMESTSFKRRVRDGSRRERDRSLQCRIPTRPSVKPTPNQAPANNCKLIKRAILPRLAYC